MTETRYNLKNLKSNLANPKIRSIFILLIIILIIAAIVGYIEFKRHATSASLASQAKTTTVPAIRSIPGVGTPSRAYIKLQQEQNIKLAREALKKQTAATPTPVRTTYLGDTLPGAEPIATTPGCSIEELRQARAAGVTAFELRCRGCSAAALKAAGYTAGELRAAGFTAAQLRAAGFTAQQLRDAGFSAKELKAAGFTDAELKTAGFVIGQKAIDCSVEALTKAHAAGVSATKLKSCGAAALKAAGYTAKELKDAGFTAGELRAAGFTAKQLKDAGFSAKELRDAGFSAKELKDAGFTAAELKAAGFTDGDLIRAGFDPNKIHPPRIIKAAVTTTAKKPGVVGIGLPTIPSAKTASTSLADQLAAIRAQQAQSLSQETWQNQMNQLQQNMEMQTDDLFNSWTPLPAQQMVVSQAKAEALTKAELAKAAAAAKQAGTAFVIPAFTPVFAVLDTAIDSDSNAPIMATIISGKLKGAKIAGSFKREGKGVVLNFVHLKVPHLNNAITIDGYAIDPASARTAMATSVNNHYLGRYGSLIAASFLSGMGSAMQSGGGSVSLTSGGILYQMKQLNPSEQAIVGLGKAGGNLAKVLQKQVNTPPTVKISAGTSIALYLKQAVAIPKTDPLLTKEK